MSSLDALHRVCRLGDVKQLKQCIEEDPSLVNCIDQKLGWGPLYRTVICGHYDASMLLLEKGADPNIRNKLGETPLHQAADNSALRLAQLLIDRKADPNATQHGNLQSDGDTPLHHASLRGDEKMVRLLLKAGASADLTNFVVLPTQIGKTPLHYAVESGSTGAVKVLLLAGASPLHRDKVRPSKSGKRPIDLTNAPEMMRILSETISATSQESSSCTSPTDKQQSFNKFPFVPQGRMSPEECKDSPRTIETLEVVDHSKPKPEKETPASRAFSFGSEFKRTPLYDWLESYKLDGLFEILVQNGYEDFESLLDLMRSTNPLNTSMLAEIGINKPGHRVRLIALLEEELREPDVEPKRAETSPFTCCTRAISRSGNELSMSLDGWLQLLGLSMLTQKFHESGYDDLEQLIFLQKTRFALDDDRLTEIGIDKVGHRHRILNKLQEEAYFGAGGNSRMRKSVLSIDRDSKKVSCESCAVM